MKKICVFLGLVYLFGFYLLASGNQIVEYTFETSAEGWTFQNEVPPYDVPRAVDISGHLGLTPSGSTYAFSYWYSPDVAIVDGKFYRLEWEMGADTTDSDTTVQFRLRANQKGSWQSWARSVNSNLGHAPSASSYKMYEMYVKPDVTSSDDQNLNFNFDIMSFSWDEDTDSWVYLESLTVTEVSYTLDKEIVNYDFATGAEGWNFQGTVPPYDEPVTASDGGHLALNPAGSTSCFSYWYSPDQPIENGKYYRARFDVSSTSTDPDTTVQFRLRANQKGSWQGWERVVNSNNQQSPNAGESKLYDIIFQPVVIGSDDDMILFSFDIMNFDLNDNATSTIYLESLQVHEITPISVLYFMEMVSVPAGTFTMGARDDGDDVQYAQDDEYPRHEVTLFEYQIGKYEVTNGQYCEVLNWALEQGYLEGSNGDIYTSGSVYTNEEILLDIEDINCQIEYKDGLFIWKSRDGYSMEHHPVVEVSWYGAVAFCNWLSKIEGVPPAYDLTTWELENQFSGGYSLPTEAEWERAAAWNESKHWIYGYCSDTVSTDRMTFYDNNPLGLTEYPHTSPVGWFDGVNISPNGDIQTVDSPSPVNSYDMSGNALEWCHDWYDPSYYASCALNNPTGPSSGSTRVMRGGSWNSYSTDCRSSSRYDRSPSDTQSYTGFRVVLRPQSKYIIR